MKLCLEELFQEISDLDTVSKAVAIFLREWIGSYKTL